MKIILWRDDYRTAIVVKPLYLGTELLFKKGEVIKVVLTVDPDDTRAYVGKNGKTYNLLQATWREYFQFTEGINPCNEEEEIIVRREAERKRRKEMLKSGFDGGAVPVDMRQGGVPSESGVLDNGLDDEKWPQVAAEPEIKITKGMRVKIKDLTNPDRSPKFLNGLTGTVNSRNPKFPGSWNVVVTAVKQTFIIYSRNLLPLVDPEKISNDNYMFVSGMKNRNKCAENSKGIGNYYQYGSPTEYDDIPTFLAPPSYLKHFPKWLKGGIEIPLVNEDSFLIPGMEIKSRINQKNLTMAVKNLLAVVNNQKQQLRDRR